MNRVAFQTSHRSVRWLGLVALVVVLAPSFGAASTASGRSIAQSPGGGFPHVVAQAGTTIPQARVNFGMRPVANDAMPVIGMKQGWFKDVGITIGPSPLGFKSTFNNAVPLLVNGQLDAEGLDPIPTISTLKSVTNVRFIALSVLFIGYQILAAPSTHAKTVAQFMKQGLTFHQAMSKTLQQIKGQTFTIPPIISDRGFLTLAFQAAGLDMFKDTHVQVTQDSTALNLASGGRVKFATFDGAPFTAQLLGAGWIPLVTPLDLAKGLPGGPTSPAELLVEPPGVASPQSWAQAHPDTVLRFASVIFRVIHAVYANPQRELQYELPFINAFAGTSLTIHELQSNILKLDPPIPFEQQAPYFDNPSSTLYYRNWFRATLNYNISKGVVPKGNYNADNLIWAGPVYHQLLNFKRQSDRLFHQLTLKKLSGAKQGLVAKAHKYYGWYDYLDSYRFLLAASK